MENAKVTSNVCKNIVKEFVEFVFVIVTAIYIPQWQVRHPTRIFLSKVCTKLEEKKNPLNVVFKCSTFSHYLWFFKILKYN